MERAIAGYHRDEAGDWVAELACGHHQHVRHRPPFQLRGWVLDADERAARLGTPLACSLCDRAELPEGLAWVRTTPIWDEETMPGGLSRAHRVAAGTWGRIVVHHGRMRFTAATAPVIDVELEVGSAQAIPPEIDHQLEPLGAVRFAIEFFAVGRRSEIGEPVGQGGDPACWVGLACPDCGAMVEGGHHRPGCPAARTS
ncbi:MAG TPA: DUF3565 domain-containing protein [Acidimicrobiales bacterium]